METITYTTKQINREFRIKVFGHIDGKKVNILVGVSGLYRIVDNDDLTKRFIARAFNSMGDCCECRLRRGVKISFYVK